MLPVNEFNSNQLGKPGTRRCSEPQNRCPEVPQNVWSNSIPQTTTLSLLWTEGLKWGRVQAQGCFILVITVTGQDIYNK